MVVINEERCLFVTSLRLDSAGFGVRSVAKCCQDVFPFAVRIDRVQSFL
jgi:hypothetical protein